MFDAFLERGIWRTASEVAPRRAQNYYALACLGQFLILRSVGGAAIHAEGVFDQRLSIV